MAAPGTLSQSDVAAGPTSRISKIRDGLTPREWTKVGLMAASILGLSIAGRGMLVLALRGHHHVNKTECFGFGTGVLAYTPGMRHAFDADPIAAIDNTTRKLIQDGEQPLSVGYFFSLGHSTVVFILAVLLNFGIRALNGAMKNNTSALHHWTGIIGTSISGTFLYLIGVLNLVVLFSIFRVSREMRQGRYDDAELFGLGFDTATEVALLVLAGSAVVGGLPFYAVISLPILFAAGMCLFDTIDGCFMNFAYDWAFSKPIRKIYYNLTITSLSVFIALFIGTIEILGLIAQETNQSGGVWDLVAKFNINRAGFIIVGVFVATWVVALAIWHFGDIERKWETQAAQAYANEGTSLHD